MRSVELIEHFAMPGFSERNGQLDTPGSRQIVIVEYFADRWAESFKPDATIFVVVLNVAHLCRLVDVGIDHERIAFAIRIAPTEYEHTSRVALPGVVLDMTEQRL